MLNILVFIRYDQMASLYIFFKIFIFKEYGITATHLFLVYRAPVWPLVPEEELLWTDVSEKLFI